MQTSPTPPFLEDILATLAIDINALDTETLFSCRPIKWTTYEKDTVVGRFRGEISLADLNEFKESLEDLVTDKIMRVVLDLADASLSRTAIGALFAFAASMYGRNKRLYLFRISDQLRGKLDRLGLHRFFTYIETEEDIITKLVI